MSISTEITYSKNIPENIKKFELSNDVDFKTNSKSSESNLYKLFDNNLETYYQTSSSCPHTITFTFTKPISINYFAAYRNSSDSSYCPEKNSFVLTLNNGSVVSLKEQVFKKSTDWVLVEFIKCPKIIKLMYSIDRNHSSGCDSRVRQIKLFSKVSFQELDPIVHRKMLIADLYHQLPKDYESGLDKFNNLERVIAPTPDRVAPDVILESEEGNCFQAHKFVCGMLSKKLYEDILKEEKKASGLVIHKMIGVKSLFIRAILNFAYGNMNAFSLYLDEIEAVENKTKVSELDSSRKDKGYSKEDLMRVFGDLVNFLEVSERYSMILLSDHIETRIIKIIEASLSKQSSKQVRLTRSIYMYISDIQSCPKSLLYKFSDFLSKRPDLLSNHLISRLTKTELACIISIGSTRIKNLDSITEGDLKEAFDEVFQSGEKKAKSCKSENENENNNNNDNIEKDNKDSDYHNTGSILTFKPGSRVRIRDDVSVFYFGRGGIEHSDVGVITSVSEDGIIHVDFNKEGKPAWRGLLDEIESA